MNHYYHVSPASVVRSFLASMKLAERAKSERGQSTPEFAGVILLAMFVVVGLMLLFELITGIDLFAKVHAVLEWLFMAPLAGVLYQGWTKDVSLDEKAKNLLARLSKVDGEAKAKEMACTLLDKWGEVNFEFVRDLGEYVFEAEQEVYSH
jgi:hypothetical protein